MAQFTLDPEALAGKYEALREDVNGDRDVMHKRIATLEELNKEAHRKYAELQKKAHELQQQVVFAKAGVPTTTKGVPMMTATKAPLQNVENVPSGENIPSLKRETLASPSSEAMQQTVHVLAETEVALQEARQEHELSTQAHQLEVDNLLDALEKKDRELREQDVRIETLLAFVPDKDVAMVFDGSDKPPVCHDLDADLDAIADGTVSPRHVGRPVIVARFPQKSTEPSSVDIRGGRGEMIEAPDDAIANAPHKPRPRAEKEWRAAAERRRKEAAAQEAPERAQESAVEETKEVVKQETTQMKVVKEEVSRGEAPTQQVPTKQEPTTKKKTASRWGGAVKQIAENRRKAIEAAHEDALRKRDEQLEELRNEITKLTEDNKAKDERLYAAARDVVDAKRESVDARARLGRAELDLAVAHRATRQESVGLRQRYEREAQQARLALQAEIRGATVEIREDRDAALKRLEHVESLLKAQGGSENKQLVATKRANKVLMKRVENVNMLRKKEKAGFNQATTELQKEVEKLQKALKKATQPQKENNPQAVLKARRKSKALEEARKYSFAGRPEPSQWYPRG